MDARRQSQTQGCETHQTNPKNCGQIHILYHDAANLLASYAAKHAGKHPVLNYRIMGSNELQSLVPSPSSSWQEGDENEMWFPGFPSIRILPNRSATAGSGKSAPGRCRCRLSWW